MMKLINYSLCVFAAIGITACDFEVDNNLPGVPDTGFFAAVAANQHAGEDEILAAAAIFSDGDPINLVGGDAFEVSTTAESTLLLKRGFYVGTYTGNVDNVQNLSDVTMTIVHDNAAVTEKRWYPIEMFNIDPGPGELVGGKASMKLPPEPAINSPAPNTIFTDINDTFDLMWTDAGAGDTIAVRGVVECGVEPNVEIYGVDVTLADDSDGMVTLRLDQFIFDLFGDLGSVDFILDEARAMLLELLNKLSAGGINEDNFDEFFPVNPIDSNCEIRVFLFRERPGTFASPSTTGRITGSRSDDVIIQYQPAP